MKIAAAMSGGVDSSVAAGLMHRAGRETVGVHLQLRPRTGEPESNCTSLKHGEDARRAAEAIGIPFVELDFQTCFEREIVAPFIAAYQAGETPNPCIRCNSRVKFGPLLEWAAAEGFDKAVTGHYARVRWDEATGRWQLLRAACREKDQSYYLAELRQEQLARLAFPLGELESKQETRRLAREWSLPVADKPDSQDVCLTAGQDYRSFLADRLGPTAAPGGGSIVNTRGETIGRHSGYMNYTVGQRRGLGISHSGPLYVVEVRPETNVVVVGEEDDLQRGRLRAARVNWVGIAPPSAPIRAEAQIRYRHAPASATIIPLDGGDVEVEFDEPQRAIAPGQFAAFYDGEILLGGGWIQRA